MPAMTAGIFGELANSEMAAALGVLMPSVFTGEPKATGPYEDELHRGVPAFELVTEPLLLIVLPLGVLAGVMNGEKPPPACPTYQHLERGVSTSPANSSTIKALVLQGANQCHHSAQHMLLHVPPLVLGWKHLTAYLKLKKLGLPRQQSHCGPWEWRCLKEKRSWTVSAETRSDSCSNGLSLSHCN